MSVDSSRSVGRKPHDAAVYEITPGKAPMRASTTKDGLTVRVIAGTTSVIVGIDLQKNKRPGCLGFTIRRTDLGAVGQPAPAGAPIALPNMLKFPSDTAAR